MNEFTTLLTRLGRGGAFGYFWRLHDKQSTWFPTDRIPAAPTGARDLYFNVHPVATAKGAHARGKIEDVAAINCLFAEFDGKDFGGKDAALDYVMRLFPRPSVVIDSGGGFHCYWLLADTFYLHDAASRERAERLQKAWVTYTGGDPGAADLARVLRVPGTLNTKYDPPREVRFVHADFQCVYELSELEALAGDTLPVRGNGHKQEEPPAHNDGKIRQGTRNVTLFKLGCAMRRRGATPENIETALLLENAARCDPPLTEEEVLSIAKSAAGYAPTPDNGQGWPLSDAGNAEAFAAHYANRVVYAHAQKTWLIWDSHVWRRDQDGAVTRMALEHLRQREAQALTIDDHDKRKRVMTFLLASESGYRINSMLSLAKALKPIAMSGEEFDRHAELLAVANGVLDLTTGLLREGRPEDYLTQQARAHYDSDATCPAWERFLRDVFAGDEEMVAFIQRAVGYSLTGWTREQVFFYLWGNKGTNGKSTFLGVLRDLLGDYAANVSFGVFTANRRDGEAPQPALMGLAGKRFVTALEKKAVATLDSDTLKIITGEDAVSGRRLFENTWTYKPVFKLWLAANGLPGVDDYTDAFWRRPVLIPFTVSFEGREDRMLGDKLRQELPGILAWAVRGCLEYQAGGLKPPQKCLDAKAAWRSENDPLADFVEDACIVGKGHRAQAATLFNAYEAYCQRTGSVQVLRHPRGFSQALQARGFRRVRTPQAVFFEGIAPKA